MVDAGVGAHKSQAVLDDDRPRARAQDGVALAQDQLDQPGVLIDLHRQLAGARGRRDPHQVDQAPFGFGDDLLSENQDIAILQAEAERAGNAASTIAARSSPGWINGIPGSGVRERVMDKLKHLAVRRWRCWQS